MMQSDFILIMAILAAFVLAVIGLGLIVMNRLLLRKTRETDEELKHSLQVFGNQLIEEFTALLDAMHRDALEKNRAALDRLRDSGPGAGLSARLDTLEQGVALMHKELSRVAELVPDPKKQSEALSDAVAGIRSQIDRQEVLMRKLAEEARAGKGVVERLDKALAELESLKKRLDRMAAGGKTTVA